MPDYFSHIIIAEKIYENLTVADKKKIVSHSRYLLGAQGGDVFFAYNASFKKSNLGRRLHRMSAAEVFEKLSRGDLSYAAGFATHYALDSTLHPAVYAYEHIAKSPLAHMNFEKDLGLYVSRKFAVPRKILPRDKVMKSTFPIYDSVKLLDPAVTVTGIERCLSRHFAYTRFLYKNKKQKYKYSYDYSSLSGAIEDSIAFGTKAVESVLSRNPDPALFSKSFLEK